MNPTPYIATAASSSDAPEGAVPIAIYGIPRSTTNLTNVPTDADLAAVIAAHNALLARLRTAGILGNA